MRSKHRHPCPMANHPRRAHAVIAAALAAVALTVVAPGCGQHAFSSFDRVNHLHNDTNQQLADSSLDGFGKFTSQQSGLATTLEKNLQARRELETTVANARAALDDIQRAFTTTDVTWTELRLQVFRNLGLPPEFASESASARGDVELSERIIVRQALVGAVGKDLELLGRVQQALLEQARADAALAKADLADAQNELAIKAGPVGDVPKAEDPKDTSGDGAGSTDASGASDTGTVKRRTSRRRRNENSAMRSAANVSSGR